MGDAVLFRVAAGPQIGFGHLVRAVSLSRVLGVTPVVALRGGRTARTTARRLGCSLIDAAPNAALLSRLPGVLVVDDPSAHAAQPWVRAARCRRIPVAGILDRGIGARDVDLVIDGSPRARASRRHPSRQLLGPRFMVLDPVFSRMRSCRSGGVTPGSVAIALGGGVHAGYADEVAEILERALGVGRIHVAPGFAARQTRGGAGRHSGRAHARLLAHAEVALVGGGIGLYEACCLGIPTVAVAVTPAQRPTVRAFAQIGAVVDGGILTPGHATHLDASRRLAARVLQVLENSAARAHLGSRARRVVDGRGGFRVATAVRHLVRVGTGARGGAR